MGKEAMFSWSCEAIGVIGGIVGLALLVLIIRDIWKPEKQEEIDLNPEHLVPAIYALDGDDLSVFSSIEVAECYFKPWIVEETLEYFDGCGRILDATLALNLKHANIHFVLAIDKEPEKERLAQIIRRVVLSTKGIDLPPQLGLEELNTYVLINKIGYIHGWD